MSIYILFIKYSKKRQVKVGAKGMIAIDAGSYLYVGSAKKSWEKRVGRHLASEKKLRWHIDYILAPQEAAVVEVMLNHDNYECSTAKHLSQLDGVNSLAKKIGSSDCQCHTHFFHLKDGFYLVKKALEKLAYKSVDIGQI
ncbi:MAG: GIY-YIG nuclease family protein [Magnetococcales bacterium]|nr:GIY-YIG nuclease family protein [Magnetococcales bacterium]